MPARFMSLLLIAGPLLLTPIFSSAADISTQLRVAHFDLDPLFSPGDPPEQVTHNISHLVARVGNIRARASNTAVYLSAFSNPNGETAHTTVFFPSSHLKERGGALQFADAEFPQGELLARVAREIKRAQPDVKVYAWMPMLNFEVAPNSRYYRAVKNAYIESSRVEEGSYRRLSPFIGPVWDVVADIYRDLGRSAGRYLDGIVFHDDGAISADEDSNPASQNFFNSYDWSAHGLADPRRWQDLNDRERGQRKSRYLTHFSRYMAVQAQDALNAKFGLNKTLATARHVYSSAFANPRAVEWLAQDPDDLLANYDFVAVEVYPYMEARATVPAYWSASFCDTASSQGCIALDTRDYYDKVLSAMAARNASDKLIFVLQTVDWDLGRGVAADIASDLIGRDMQYLFERGAMHFGWYTDRYFPGSEHPGTNSEFGMMLGARL